MPLYDWKCRKCKTEFEYIAKMDEEVIKCPLCWDADADRIFPQSAPSFKLTYDPKKDKVDWDGNTTRYYDEYKKMKAEGKKPRIPALDGDKQ
jgi:putative FmdB family regulatory protein